MQQPGVLESALASVVGAGHMLTDPDLRAAAEVDWTGRWRGSCRAVVLPGTAGELARALRECVAAGVPVVPQGGNTGLVGGSVPVDLPGAVVLSTRRLTGLAPVSTDGTVVVGTGATLAAVQAHARGAGWDFGPDFASRDSATVGGAVATNAGGLRVLRWGPARAQLVGAEVALSSGALLSRVDGPLKDSTGYDLSGLLCGSEGTLGVLTRVRLRLVPSLPAERAVALVGVASVAAAAPLAERWPAYVLLETAGPDALDSLAGALSTASGLGDAVLAGDATGRARLWRCREELTPAVAAAGTPVKLDVSLPAARLSEVCGTRCRASSTRSRPARR